MALTPDKTRIECGLKIHEKIIPWGAVWTKDSGSYKKGNKYKADRILSSGSGKVAGVTIHNTDGGANAETYTRATYPNQNMNDSRVHYYVDDVEAWQNLLETEVGWHAGDGRGNGNETTVSIEIIMRGAAIKDDAKSEDNGARLAAAILARHGLNVDQLYTHNKWMGLPDSIVNGARKNCPLYILSRWADFKAKVKAYMVQYGGGSTGGSTTTPPAPEVPATDAPAAPEPSKPTPEVPAPALDNTPREWEKKAVEMAISRGIIQGDTTGNLRLHEAATRADVLVLLERCGVL